MKFILLAVVLLCAQIASCSLARFEGKIVLVTGGSSGIGKATALEFFKECATVVIASRNETKLNLAAQEILIEGAGERAKSCNAPSIPGIYFQIVDTREMMQARAMVANITSTFGTLDIAVNNAGIGGAIGNLADLPDSHFFGEHDALRNNLYGTMLSAREEVKYWVEAGKSGIIVNTASENGLRACGSCPLYASSKFGIIGLTKSIALAHASSKNRIRANCIAPGLVDTPLTRNQAKFFYESPPLQPWECMKDGKVSEGPCNDVSETDPLWIKMRDDAIKEIPKGRVAAPKEMARVILFLASDDASYMTGEVISIDGGDTA